MRWVRKETIIEHQSGTQCLDDLAKRRQNVPLSYHSANILAHLIDFLNRECKGNPQKNQQNHSWLKIHPANLIRLAYWRRRVVSANTIGTGEVEALQKIRNALPIRQDIAY
jgi:hypothetical protein